MRRWTAIGAAVLALAGAGSAIARATGAHPAQTAAGGLSISPAVIERPAQLGPIGPVTVTNRSRAPLDVTVAARPWRQGNDGRVAADRRYALPQIQIGRPAFTLAPGASQAVDVAVAAVPSSGAGYGALEIVGVPAGAAARRGVVLGYRLIATLRLLPAQPRLRLTAGLSAARGTLFADVHNAGNTLSPVTGSVRIKSARGTRNGSLQAVRILPGRTLHLALASRLPRGAYTARLALRQGGKRALTVSRRLAVR